MKATLTAIALSLALLAAGCGEDDSATESGGQEAAAPAVASGEDAANREKPEVSVPQGSAPGELVETDLIEGSGEAAEAGDEVSVHYVGVDYENGEQFDASWDRGEPFSFQLGAGHVIPGWDRGVEGMKVGGRRQLVIPPDLAYGEAGVPPTIGPEATLVFVVDLLEVN